MKRSAITKSMIAGLGFFLLAGCCGQLKQSVKDASHAIDNAAGVAQAELAACKKHDAKACADVEKKLNDITTTSQSLKAVTE